jgi:ketosteroid isomerase-like protein
MSRLGSWEPTNAEDRVDRIESLAMIRQLAVRYALAVDSKDFDALVDLFVPDVRVGRERQGREALAEWFRSTLGRLDASVHFVGNHIVSFDDADHARGIVYCRDELDHAGSDEWQVGMLQYWDTYVRVDSEWCFERRRFHRWYIGDVLERPAIGAGLNAPGDPMATNLLPESFANLGSFLSGELA